MQPFQLPIARYRFTFQAETLVRFPPYSGSTWRGAFGHALRQTVCVTREPSCAGCLLRRSCVYSYVFDTVAEQEPMLAKIETAPHPYIVQPLATSGQRYQAGDLFDVDFTLMGKAIEHLPYLIHALTRAGQRGVGKQAGQAQLIRVEQEHTLGSNNWQLIYTPTTALTTLPMIMPVVPALPKNVSVKLLTPYRGLLDGKLITPRRFLFKAFMLGIMRRIQLLHGHLMGITLAMEAKTLSQQAATIPLLNPDLRWYDWARYSNRQQTEVQMGGVIGTFDLPAEQLPDCWEWLWWGQWTHVGKGAVMGLGQYSLLTD